MHVGAVQATIRPEINVAIQNIGLNKVCFRGDKSCRQLKSGEAKVEAKAERATAYAVPGSCDY